MVADENGSRFGRTDMLPVLADGELILIAGALLAAGHARLARRGATARAGPAALPLPGHGHRLRRPGLDRLQRLPARAPDRDHRAGPDPLRGRPDLGAARDPPRADARAEPGDRGHDHHRGRHRLRGRRGSSTSRRSTGCCSGSVLAATDGAAIFALLRGSTLKRRLATTLEGESGFNDPVAVLLVLGFIEWLQHDDYGHRRTWRCSSSARSASAWPSASWWGWPPRGRCGA